MVSIVPHGAISAYRTYGLIALALGHPGAMSYDEPPIRAAMLATLALAARLRRYSYCYSIRAASDRYS